MGSVERRERPHTHTHISLCWKWDWEAGESQLKQRQCNPQQGFQLVPFLVFLEPNQSRKQGNPRLGLLPVGVHTWRQSHKTAEVRCYAVASGPEAKAA